MSKSKPSSQRHHRTRNDHANETAEDYVEAIAEWIERRGECRVRDLAQQFGVSHVTVSKTVKRLQAESLVETRPYQPITLTRRGRRLAERSRARHEIVLQFLLALGIDEETATIDSEGIEHHVSPETLKAMERFLRRDQSKR